MADQPKLTAISKIKPNPDNPRVIRDEKFKKLVQSLKDFPEMTEVRPIVCNKQMMVLGGNMRLRAMQEAGWKEVPVTVVAWSKEKQREFIVKDNLGYGEWDWEVLANEWDGDVLEDWGMDTLMLLAEPEGDDLIGEDKDKPPTLKITFTSPEQLQKAEVEIQELLDRKYEGAYFSVSAGEI